MPNIIINLISIYRPFSKKVWGCRTPPPPTHTHTQLGTPLNFIDAATKVVNSFGTDVSYSVFINNSCAQNFEDTKWQTKLEWERAVTDWYETS